jgi:hypothetical protein
MTDKRNRFSNDKEVKWVIAQRVSGGEWRVLFLSFSETCPSLEDGNKPYFDSVPQGEFNNSEFAVFKNRLDWWTKKPYRLVDYRDRSNQPIPLTVGMWLVNQADSGYF